MRQKLVVNLPAHDGVAEIPTPQDVQTRVCPEDGFLFFLDLIWYDDVRERNHGQWKHTLGKRVPTSLVFLNFANFHHRAVSTISPKLGQASEREEGDDDNILLFFSHSPTYPKPSSQSHLKLSQVEEQGDNTHNCTSPHGPTYLSNSHTYQHHTTTLSESSSYVVPVMRILIPRRHSLSPRKRRYLLAFVSRSFPKSAI